MMNFQMYEYRAAQRKKRFVRVLTKLFIYSCFILTIFLLNSENKELKLAMASAEYENAVVQSSNDFKIFELNNEILKLNATIDTMTSVICHLDEQLQEVSAINTSYVDELNSLRNRSELYDKYEYAIVNNGKRTELTYEEIEYGESLMLASGLDPDLMFGTIMVESRANPNAVNASSGATGYGQFLDSTAEWVWTGLLGNDTYYSDLRKDGTANIQMMAEYYNFLYDKYDGNTFNVVKEYSGNSTNSGASVYLSEVNRFISLVGAKIN